MGRRKGHPQRLAGWDYALAGAYFVTFQVRDRRPCLSTVAGGRVQLAPAGRPVEVCWLDLPSRFPGLVLDRMVIMPDHVHAVLFLCGALINQGPTSNQRPTSDPDPTADPDPTLLQPLMAQPGLQLGKVIRAWKTHATRLIRRAGGRGFAWQSRYWERVIRNESELHRIRRYIDSNPAALRPFVAR